MQKQPVFEHTSHLIHNLMFSFYIVYSKMKRIRRFAWYTLGWNVFRTSLVIWYVWCVEWGKNTYLNCGWSAMQISFSSMANFDAAFQSRIQFYRFSPIFLLFQLVLWMKFSLHMLGLAIYIPLEEINQNNQSSLNQCSFKFKHQADTMHTVFFSHCGCWLLLAMICRKFPLELGYQKLWQNSNQKLRSHKSEGKKRRLFLFFLFQLKAVSS